MWIHSLVFAASLASAGTPALNVPKLENDLHKILQKESRGRIGICVSSLNSETACVNRDAKFPLQSVMKMFVGATVIDLADQKKLSLSDKITLTPKDASPGPQDFSKLITKNGKLTVTIEELIRLAIVDSDSTSVDVLLEHIGGVKVVQEFFKNKQIEGISLDRNERDLQAEFSGLKWQKEYADAKVFDSAIEALPEKTRSEALAIYSKDPRDTATPLATVNFLLKIEKGEILSKTGREKFLAIMEATVTGPDRLKAGLPKTWKLAHKTGTSGKWKGVAAATNDAGLIKGPNGEVVAIAVFIADSKASDAERAALIARAASAAVDAYAPVK